MRVLYVEDEKFLADAVKYNLEKQGIDVDHAADGEEGLDMAVSGIYDCMILDIMLPKLSGIEILERVRKKGISTPVIMLSALSEVEDKVRGLNSGADDYLAKPFKTAELVARIKAILRRPSELKNNELTYSNLVLDQANMTLNGEQLTAKEGEIMMELMSAPEKLVSKEHLLAKIWGEEGLGEDNYVESYISRIRKLLKKIKSQAKIVTVRSLGYKLVS